MVGERTLTYPLALDGKGNLAVSSGSEAIKQQVVSVLQTRPYERAYRADYGFDDKIFDIVEPNAINARIIKSIEDNVKGVHNVRVVHVSTPSELDDGVYRVQILYEVEGKADSVVVNISGF